MVESTIQPTGPKKRLSAAEVARLQTLCRERLLADLVEQQATPGARLAGERRLCEQYEIPLSVVRSTLRKLKSEGLITSVPRGGVRLAAKPELPKSLAGAKVGFVGYMELTHPGSGDTRPAVICAGLERVLNEQGGTLHFFNVWEGDDFQSMVEDIKRQGIEAILFIRDSRLSDQTLLALADLGLPMVSIETASSLCPSVVFDNEQIGRTLANHILGLGHRDVCIMEYPEHEWSAVRARSIRQEFQKQGVEEPDTCSLDYPPPDNDGEPINTPNYVATYPPLVAQVREFVHRKARDYTACIAVNDELGCLLLNEAKAQGIRVPEDLSIIGADDHPAFRHFNLTTVQLSEMELGLAAFKTLKEQILDPETRKGASVQLLTCPLIVRRTTARYQPKERKES